MVRKTPLVKGFNISCWTRKELSNADDSAASGKMQVRFDILQRWALGNGLETFAGRVQRSWINEWKIRDLASSWKYSCPLNCFFYIVQTKEGCGRLRAECGAVRANFQNQCCERWQALFVNWCPIVCEMGSARSVFYRIVLRAIHSRATSRHCLAGLSDRPLAEKKMTSLRNTIG